MKQWTMVVLASLLASSLEAQTLEDLITETNNLVSAFDTSIQVVGGMEEVANWAGIVPVGASEAALLSSTVVDAFNSAASSYTANTLTAQEWLSNTAETKIIELNAAVKTFTVVASPLIQAVEISNLAQTAETDVEKEVLSEMAASSVISTTQVGEYNEAVLGVETAAAVAGAYLAAANDASLVSTATMNAREFNSTYSDVATEVFNRDTNKIEIGFSSHNSVVYLDMGAYLVDAATVLTTGATSKLYLTGPTQEACFFSASSECET